MNLDNNKSRKIKYDKYCILINNSIDNEYNEYNKHREELISYLDINYIVQFINAKRLKIAKCCGCYPFFQYNQNGHIGFHGCLEDNDIFYFSK